MRTIRVERESEHIVFFCFEIGANIFVVVLSLLVVFFFIVVVLDIFVHVLRHSFLNLFHGEKSLIFEKRETRVKENVEIVKLSLNVYSNLLR